MRYIVWALRLVVFVAVLMFALKNTGPVAVAFYGDYVVNNVPLIVVMLSTFVLGTLFGLLLTVPAALRRRREAAKLRRELDQRIKDVVHPPASQTATQDGVVPLSPL